MQGAVLFRHEFHASAHIPPHALRPLLTLANAGCDVDDVKRWYEVVLQSPSQASITVPTQQPELRRQWDPHGALTALTTSLGTVGDNVRTVGTVQSYPLPEEIGLARLQIPHAGQTGPPEVTGDRPDKIYLCPYWWHSFTKVKQLIRHVDQVCRPTRVWRCSVGGCGATFNRANRFKDHHKTIHQCHGRGDGDECRHSGAAMEALPQTYVQGCGFCNSHFVLKQRRYLQHLIKHYKEGRTKHDWNAAQQIISLLQRPDMKNAWQPGYGTRPRGFSLDMPALHGEDVEVREIVELLESSSSQNELRRCLPKLLALGFVLEGDSQAQTPGVRPSLEVEPERQQMESVRHLHEAHYTQSDVSQYLEISRYGPYANEGASQYIPHSSSEYLTSGPAWSRDESWRQDSSDADADYELDIEAPAASASPSEAIDRTMLQPFRTSTSESVAHVGGGLPPASPATFAGMSSLESGLASAGRFGTYALSDHQRWASLHVTSNQHAPYPTTAIAFTSFGEEGSILRSTDVADPPFSASPPMHRDPKRRRLLPASIREPLKGLSRPSSPSKA